MVQVNKKTVCSDFVMKYRIAVWLLLNSISAVLPASKLPSQFLKRISFVVQHHNLQSNINSSRRKDVQGVFLLLLLIFTAKRKKTTCSQQEPLFHEILSTFILVLKLCTGQEQLIRTPFFIVHYHNIFQFKTLTESDQY